MTARKPREYVAIAGPGAIGGTLAASFQKAGFQVVLVRRGKTPIRRHCKAVFICVKSPGLKWSLRAVRGLVGPDTAVVPLLNGVTHIQPVQRAYGPSRAVFGACYIAAMRTKGGKILHTGGEGVVLARTSKNRAACDAAGGILKQAGWKVGIVSSPERLLWTKTVYNAAVNPIGALAGKTNGELALDPALRDLVLATISEAALIARKAGYPPLGPNLGRRVLRGCLSAPDQVNSMAQDIAAGRKTEADAILLPLLKAAKKAGRKTRYLEPLYLSIRALEKA